MKTEKTLKNPEEDLVNRTFPSNSGLHDLFSKADKVVIKEGGVREEVALKDTIVLTITNAVTISEFASLLKIVENENSPCCACLGDYAIELLNGERLITTIGFHHGVTLRYHHWYSDASLVHEEALLHFLDAHGLHQPLQRQQESEQRSHIAENEKKEWLLHAPRCFEEYLDKAGFDPIDVVGLEAALSAEIPDEQKRIIQLLRTFGKTSYPGSGYASYKYTPMLLLEKMELKVIIQTYLDSDRSAKAKDGLARYLFSLNKPKFKLKRIPVEIFDDLENHLTSISDSWGLRKIEKWRQRKMQHDNLKPPKI